MLLVGAILREHSREICFFFSPFTSNNAKLRNMGPLSIRKVPRRGVRGSFHRLWQKQKYIYYF